MSDVVSTKNFHPDTDPKLICTCGHPDCHKPSVDQETLDMVQVVRDDLDRPMQVNSGGRCGYHPNEIRKTTVGDHGKGKGIDIACANGVERMELVQAALRAGFNAIGVAKTFVHFGHRPNAKVAVMWTYD